MTDSAWKAPCEDGATFAYRDIVIATGHCTPHVTLSIDLAGTKPPEPPLGC